MVLIVGQGPFGKNILLGTFIMSDESAESYLWCFREFDKLCPKSVDTLRVVFTDGLDAYNAVFKDPMFNSELKHLRCLWHIEKMLARKYTSSLGALFHPWWEQFKSCVNELDKRTYKEVIYFILYIYIYVVFRSLSYQMCIHVSPHI